MESTLIAFADFVLENPGAMAHVHSIERGIAILDILAQRDPIDRLVPLTYHCMLGDRLLLHLNSLAVTKNETEKFYRAVVDGSFDAFLVDTWSKETINNILANADFPDLLKHCPALYAEDHVLRGNLDLDPYWERRVRRYLVRGDYRRTWDELNKARRGFPRPSDARPDTISYKSLHVGEVIYEGRYQYACSKGMLATLIGDLFTAMMTEGFVTAVTEADTKFDGSQTTIKVYEVAAPKNGRAIRSHDKRITYSGFGFACIFRIQEGSMFSGYGKLHIFEETGAQVIKIATYFRKKEDERRQAKYDAVVAQQMNKSKAQS